MSVTLVSDRTLFLTREQAADVRERFNTPCYVYDRVGLENAAREALAFPAPYGFTLRYAMKANPSRGVLEVFRALGLHLDASSDFEVERAILAGFEPGFIQLTSQMPSKRLKEHVARGVLFNACSLHQLELFGQTAPGRSLSVRINAGLGSGSTNRTNTGGPAASFGIWKDYLADVMAIATRYGLKITTLHSHIGSGSDPETWKVVAQKTLAIAALMPDVARVNLGGGFKVGRMPAGPTVGLRHLTTADAQRPPIHRQLWQPTVDLQDVGRSVSAELEGFKERYGRALHLEIEPGTYLVARAGAVVATCVDVVDTGRGGYFFAKLDTGMTEILRPSLYGAQHPIDVLEIERDIVETVFVGPCCESGDILTPATDDPEGLSTRFVPRPKIGDLVVIGGAGAYCAAMSTINYNSYPQSPEVMLERDGTLRLLRKRQTPESVWANEDAAQRETATPPIPPLPSEAPSRLQI
jgi:diaminopimelate decarboxylase